MTAENSKGCHNFHRGGGGSKGFVHVTIFHVTIRVGGGGVKAICDNVTNFTVFFFDGFPK